MIIPLPPFSWEVNIHYILQNMYHLGMMETVTVICFVYGFLEMWDKIVIILRNVCLTYGIVSFIKMYIHAMRPYVYGIVDTTTSMNPFLGDFTSFPSGHVAVCSALFMTLFLWYKNKTKWSYLCFLPVVLVAYSRLYLNVHFGVDVLAGFLLGFFIAYFEKNCIIKIKE